MPGAKVLDLFAGTGAVGIEALSRGAELVVFVDQSKACKEQIEAALVKTGFKDKGRVLLGNLLNDLSWLPFRATISEFDLIYMGPPYKDVEGKMLAFSTASLAKVCAANLLAPTGWLMLQHHNKEAFVVPEGYESFRQMKYGDTLVDFIRRGNQLPATAAEHRRPVSACELHRFLSAR